MIRPTRRAVLLVGAAPVVALVAIAVDERLWPLGAAYLAMALLALLADGWLAMSPGALEPKFKEMLYVAVSIAHGCTYCIHSHTAAARAKGMTDQEYAEMIAIVGMAAETNRLVTALGVAVDNAFLVDPLNAGGQDL